MTTYEMAITMTEVPLCVSRSLSVTIAAVGLNDVMMIDSELPIALRRCHYTFCFLFSQFSSWCSAANNSTVLAPITGAAGGKR